MGPKTLGLMRLLLFLSTPFGMLIWAGHVVRMEEGRSAFKFLTSKLTGKTPLGQY